jgi:hypothetical protein
MSVPKIRDTYVGCPSGWWIIDPDTKTHIEANSYNNLNRKWQAHRTANNLPGGDYYQMISDQICKREPPEFCMQWPVNVGERPNVPEPSLMDMMGNFIGASVYWASKGFPVASKELFEQRISICQRCEYFEAPAYFGGGKCKKCGCCGAFKPWMETASCPDQPKRW